MLRSPNHGFDVNEKETKTEMTSLHYASAGGKIVSIFVFYTTLVYALPITFFAGSFSRIVRSRYQYRTEDVLARLQKIHSRSEASRTTSSC